MDIFRSLKCLHIEDYENLASHLVAGGTLEHLDSIVIIQCPKLVSFHEFELYASRLRSLTISKCEEGADSEVREGGSVQHECTVGGQFDNVEGGIEGL
ncbi:hypothetical protein VNO77_04117 [Canavalia gladiata]|uniref:Uncharacterized protein n=1 Tax=Canavalia gladiata TaxID=3824 RepID=A0AAN9MVY7_CANGL